MNPSGRSIPGSCTATRAPTGRRGPGPTGRDTTSCSRPSAGGRYSVPSGQPTRVASIRVNRPTSARCRRPPSWPCTTGTGPGRDRPLPPPCSQPASSPLPRATSAPTEGSLPSSVSTPSGLVSTRATRSSRSITAGSRSPTRSARRSVPDHRGIRARRSSPRPAEQDAGRHVGCAGRCGVRADIVR